MNALGDAANVGGKEGINPAAAKSAVEALVGLEKNFPRALWNKREKRSTRSVLKKKPMYSLAIVGETERKWSVSLCRHSHRVRHM